MTRSSIIFDFVGQYRPFVAISPVVTRWGQKFDRDYDYQYLV